MIDIRLPANGERWRKKPDRSIAGHPLVTIDGVIRKAGMEWVTWHAQLRANARVLGGDRLDGFLRDYEPDEGPGK